MHNLQDVCPDLTERLMNLTEELQVWSRRSSNSDLLSDEKRRVRFHSRRVRGAIQRAHTQIEAIM